MDVFQEIKDIPELNFVLLCGCVEPNSKRQEKIKKLSDTSLNWDLIYDISRNQRVFPLLFKNIQTIIPDKAPIQFFQKLKNHFFQNTTRNLSHLGMLISILNLFQNHGIEVVPFKGPVLAEDLYGDIGLRIFADLDILVSKENALIAWKLLAGKGFHSELELSEKQILKYVIVEDNISFSKKNTNLTIELHWEMSGIYLTKPLMLTHIKKRLYRISVNNHTIPNLSSEDLLLYLCIHGAKHKWEYLELVCCVSELIKTKNNLDWAFIEQSSDRWKCKKILNLGLYLSKKIFDAPVPDLIYSEIQTNKDIILLANECVEYMFQSHLYKKKTDKSRRFSNFHLKIKDSFPDKLLYSLRLLFRPTKREWLYYPVPASLFFLHFILRPLRLGIALLRKQNA